MRKLLIDEYPMQVLPGLAEKIGLNEALFLQQVHYWLNTSGKQRDGQKWVYNTYDEWVEQFPFWSKSTIKRIINGLVDNEFLIKGNYNKAKFDRTNWYTINYNKIDSLERPYGQNDPTIGSVCTKEKVQDEPTYTRDYTETTSESSSSAFAFYQNNLGVINSFIADNITHWIDDLSEELVIESMKIALKANKQFNYAEGILRDWHKRNIRTLDDVSAAQKQFERTRNKKEVNLDEFDLDDDKSPYIGFD